MSPRKKLEQIHSEIAAVGGRLALALTQPKLPRGLLGDMLSILRVQVTAIEALTAELEKKV